VDLDPRDLATELARALAAPAVGRFVRAGATDLVVADAHARLAGLAGPGLGRVKSTEQLLAQWGNELRLVDARAGDGEDAIRAGWLGVAGAALATSAVAGGAVAAISPAEGDMLGAAMLSHAVGVLHLGPELGELRADPLGGLELRRSHAAKLLRTAEIAITDARTAAPAAWLWLELEEGAARAAAAATIVALTLAEPPHS